MECEQTSQDKIWMQAWHTGLFARFGNAPENITDGTIGGGVRVIIRD
jgi:hypothetical protein